MSNASFSEDEVVFELAELNGGWLDDFNRWNFPGDDKLLDFVEVIKRRERQAIWDILINYASRDDLSDDDDSLLLHLGRLIQARGETK